MDCWNSSVPSKGRKKVQIFTSLASKQTAINSPLCLCAESLQQVYHGSQKGGQPQQVPPLCKLPHCCYLLVVLLHWLQKWEIYYSGSSIIEGTHDPSWPSRKKHTRLLQPNTKELCLLDLSSSFSSNARALDLLWTSSTCFLLFFSLLLLLLFLPPPPCTLVSTACQQFVSLSTIPMTDNGHFFVE